MHGLTLPLIHNMHMAREATRALPKQAVGRGLQRDQVRLPGHALFPCPSCCRLHVCDCFLVMHAHFDRAQALKEHGTESGWLHLRLCWVLLPLASLHLLPQQLMALLPV